MIKTGLCGGDSGGPAIAFDSSLGNQQFVQIGIIHGGVRECYNDDFPAIIVRMDHPDILNFVQGVIYKQDNKSKHRSKFFWVVRDGVTGGSEGSFDPPDFSIL